MVLICNIHITTHQLHRRDDRTGKWPAIPCANPPPAPHPKPLPEPFVPGTPEDQRTFYQTSNDVERTVCKALVTVDFQVPYPTEFVRQVGVKFRGTGVVVDHEKGLVVVDRLTAVTAAGDARITFGSSVSVPASVV